MPEDLLSNLYKGLGGQPGRVTDRDRMMQLTVRALTKGARIEGILKHLHERDRKALATLVQCGGVAQDEEFIRELTLSYGGHEREWKKSMNVLANRGFVFATAATATNFYYVIPEHMMDGLVLSLEEDLALATFEHDDMRLLKAHVLSTLEFSVTSLATYIDQNGPRLTTPRDLSP